MKIRYVGLKDAETKFSKELGIVWTQGSEHEVSEAWAKRLLTYKDMWAAAGQAPAPAPAPAPEPKNVIVIGEGDAAKEVVLDDMDAPALHALAKELGVQVHQASGKAKVIAAIMAEGKAQ